MGTYTQYSATASSNNGAAPVGAPEGVAPGSVNDIIREMQATIRTLGDSTADGSLPGSGTPIPVARGGTGSSTAATARTALGLGTAATYNVGTAAGEVPTNAQVVGQVPVGGIILWWGTIWTWPDNYKPCDGTNGTPDLRGRVPVCPSDGYPYTTAGGADTQASSSAGAHTHGGATGSGGAHSHGGVTGGHALTVGQLPAHSHTTPQDITEGGSGRFASGGNGQSTTSTTSSVGGNEAHSHTIGTESAHTHTIASDGGHQHTVDVRQPWMSLWFLMRVS